MQPPCGSPNESGDVHAHKHAIGMTFRHPLGCDFIAMTGMQKAPCDMLALSSHNGMQDPDFIFIRQGPGKAEEAGLGAKKASRSGKKSKRPGQPDSAPGPSGEAGGGASGAKPAPEKADTEEDQELILRFFAMDNK